MKYRCNPIIESTDREIDLMFYELYELTQKEIEIVENGQLTNLNYKPQRGVFMTNRAEDSVIDQGRYEQYFTNLIQGKRIPCYNIVNDLISNQFNIKTLYQNLLQRSLYSVGELWEYNKITVATEHMATLITESLMNQMSPHLPIGESVNKRVVISSVEDEPHQIGGKMAADIFEIHGWDAIYLGANTPAAELIDFIKAVEPNLVGLSMSVYFHIDTLKKTLSLINSSFNKLPVIVGGQAFKQGADSVIKNFNNTTYIPDLEALEDYIANFSN